MRAHAGHLARAGLGYVGLNRSGIGFLLPAIVAELRLEYWQASLFISGTSATHALAAWFGGTLSDRLGRKPVFLVGRYASTVFSAAFGAVGGASFVTFGLAGLSNAGMVVVLTLANFCVGTFLMPFVGGLAADRLGLVVPIVVAGLAVLLIAPVVVGVPETAPRLLAPLRTARSDLSEE